MESTNKLSRKLLLCTIAFALCICAPLAAFGQKESLGTTAYSAPAGFAKTTKENIVAFSKVDAKTGAFCIITLYGATPGTGTPESDFKREWANIVLKNMKADADPKTESSVENGWTATGGGSAVDSDAGKAFALLTVISGGGRTVSILGVFNDQSYLPELAAFSDSIDPGKATSQAVAPVSGSARSAPQTDGNGNLIIPLATRQLTLADIAGNWGENAGINIRYVDRYSGTYAGADSLHFKSEMMFTAAGAYYDDFAAIQNGRMIKEKTAGTVAINGQILSIKIANRNLQKYVIRGWLELPDMTILEVCGPWYNDDVIPPGIFAGGGANLDKKWIRKK
ncbi:MAG: hypothetical protein ABIP78_01040 [Pyrinomonadaceae bacterium]